MDTTKGEPVEPFGFSSAEIAYLLGRIPGQAALDVGQRLGIDLAALSEDYLAAGASALLVRGLLSVEGDDLEIVGPAWELVAALAITRRFTDVGFMSEHDSIIDGFIVAGSAEATVLVQPRALGTWYMLEKNPELSDGAAVFAMARAFLLDHVDGAVFVASQGSGEQGVDTTAYVRRSENGGWNVAQGAGDAELTIARLESDSAAIALLDTLLALD